MAGKRSVKSDAFASFHFQSDLVSRVENVTGSARGGLDRCRNQTTFLPRQINFKTAPSAQSFDHSVFPRFGQPGKQMDAAVFTLQQHLGNGGGHPKVAVNLKWRAGVKKIWINPAAVIVSHIHPVSWRQR